MGLLIDHTIPCLAKPRLGSHKIHLGAGTPYVLYWSRPLSSCTNCVILDRNLYNPESIMPDHVLNLFVPVRGALTSPSPLPTLLLGAQQFCYQLYGHACSEEKTEKWDFVRSTSHGQRISFFSFQETKRLYRIRNWISENKFKFLKT